MINNNTDRNTSIPSTNYKKFTNNIEKHLKFSEYVYPLNDGFYHITNSNCSLTQDVHIRSGKKNGAGKIYTPDGNVYSVNFVNNIPQGPCSRVDSLGNILSYEVVNGSPFGEAVEVLKDRTVYFSYGKNGLRNGKAVEFNRYGKIEFNYINDVKQLATKITGHDGKTYFLYYQSGNLNGDAKIYLPNKIIYCNYKNGVPDGKASMILANKNEIKFNYVNGIPQGDAIETYEQGFARFTLNTGKIVGTVNFYNRTGSCLARATAKEDIFHYALKVGSSITYNDMMETLYMERPSIPQKAPVHPRNPEKLKNDFSPNKPSSTNKEFYGNEDSFDFEEQVLDSYNDLSSPSETDGLETCFMEDEKSSASVDNGSCLEVDSWLNF